ncbi:hypothetical protein JWZ98_09000 [Methylomonas sp. EFPC1]|uniref:hypothetical protein n=1 Tax=unclassified Methylomonas TaxID=2608980 RepID=UPI000C33160D|nr:MULTISPECIES: hypothetical protein [unclassified Methylomonas]PKD38110.1 hypothetical protein CWO84_23050 [Methylomonas sp. Kb3]QSB03044.1 hypothetical protein JWZ98_09000 [Methylomonas sp. EFPC1]
MKKYLTIICLVIASFSFQVNASTLSWSTITGYGPILGSLQSGQNSPQDLFGIVTGLRIETNVLDDWTFNLHNSSQVRVSVSSLEANTGSLLYAVNLDGSPLAKSAGPADEAWSFDGILTAGSHTINILGIAISLESTSGYQVNVSAMNAVVPIPAVGWIFSFFLFYMFRNMPRRRGY